MELQFMSSLKISKKEFPADWYLPLKPGNTNPFLDNNLVLHNNPFLDPGQTLGRNSQFPGSNTNTIPPPVSLPNPLPSLGPFHN